MLRWDWEWFCTFTFAKEKHPEAAAKAFRYWVSVLERRIYGKSGVRRGERLGWVRGLEWQRRDVVHYHALVRGTRNYLRIDADALWWKQMREGFSQVRPASADGAAAYISKYVAKGGEIDLAEHIDCASLRQLGFNRAG